MNITQTGRIKRMIARGLKDYQIVGEFVNERAELHWTNPDRYSVLGKKPSQKLRLALYAKVKRIRAALSPCPARNRAE